MAVAMLLLSSQNDIHKKQGSKTMSITFTLGKKEFDAENRVVFAMIESENEFNLANGNAFAILSALNVPQEEVDYCGYFLSSQFPDLRKIINRRLANVASGLLYRDASPEMLDRARYVADRLTKFRDLMTEAEQKNHEMIVWG
jgi:hypothetical protein